MCLSIPSACSSGCPLNTVVVNMTDTWGDGWNGNTYTLTNSTGVVVATGTLPNGAAGSDTYCLPDDCYMITVGGGAWQNEVGWNITVNGGAPVASATAPNGIVTNQQVSINAPCSVQVVPICRLSFSTLYYF